MPPPPAPVAGGPLRPKAPDRLRMAADREGLPPGPLRPVGLGSANGAPRARPLPPQPPGHGGTGRLTPPPTPPCAALGSARRAERLRAAARHALGGGLGGFTRSAAAGAQGRPARRRQPWPWGPRAPSPGSAALPPPPPSRLPEQPGGGPLWRPSPRLGPPNFPALAARGIRPAPRAARPR